MFCLKYWYSKATRPSKVVPLEAKLPIPACVRDPGSGFPRLSGRDAGLTVVTSDR